MAPDPREALVLRPSAVNLLKAKAGVNTDQELAEALGVSRKLISRVKAGAPVNNALLTGLYRNFGALDDTLFALAPAA